MKVLRGVFLLAVLVFAWLSLRGRWSEIGDGLRDTSAIGALAGLGLVLLGLLSTGMIWMRLMARLGARLPRVEGLAIFFVGQLGKYVPGSVWSIGAQADLARRHDVPVRWTVTAGLLLLGYHVDTAVLVGALALVTGAVDSPWPAWVAVAALVSAIVGLLPGVVRFAARRVARQEVRIQPADTVVVVALMAIAWSAYASALVLLTPAMRWGHLAAYGGAFAAAFAVGVVVVFAPAGVGARETVFVLLLTPLTGVGPATALALLARVVHTAADGLMAAGWWLGARAARRREGARPDGMPDP